MASLTTLTSTLSNSPHDFLQSTSVLHAASLVVAKQFLDPLAASVNASKKARRRNQNSDVTVLDQIYLDGFDVEQVWEQVRGLVVEIEGTLGDTLSKVLKAKSSKTEAIPVVNGRKRKTVHFGLSENEAVSEGELPSDGETKQEDVSEMGEDDDKSMGDDEEGSDAESLDKKTDGMEDIELDGEDDEEEPTEIFIQDVHGLNDGFFSIDEFNRQTEMFERIDYNGESFDTDEEVDLNVDPQQLSHSDIKNRQKEGEFDDEEDEEDEEEEYFDEDLDESENANDVLYADFFAPPPKKGVSRSQQKKQSWKDQVPKKSAEDEGQNLARIEADMERVNHDLFDDEVSEQESKGDPGVLGNRKSAYERRQAALNEQIRKLELSNVQKKDWTLAGEAKASQRPLNSLLEEDLDFERIGKPVPVITQDVTETLEDMIKRRILAGQFDELQKRRPVDTPTDFKRGRIELDDSKAQSSLAEIYEQDHLQKVGPAGNPSAKDEKLRKEHEEISSMFNDIVTKLDALSSWHYTPKPAKPSISIVSDAPAISMEEAQPTVGGGGAAAAEASMLAPQEVFNPFKDRKEGPKVSDDVKEIVGKSGAPVSVAEMTTEEKQKRRKHNKEKERKKKASEGMTHGGKAKEGSKKDILDTLSKGGVKVIGKGGEKRDVHGNAVKVKKGVLSSSSFKL